MRGRDRECSLNRSKKHNFAIRIISRFSCRMRTVGSTRPSPGKGEGGGEVKFRDDVIARGYGAESM